MLRKQIVLDDLVSPCRRTALNAVRRYPVPTRIPNHGEDVAKLQALNILVDGAPEDSGMLLQIFTQNLIGPIFFEIIQRKGNQGFGEGNFKALFESIELDQIRRGVLTA